MTNKEKLEQIQDRLETQIDILTNFLIKVNEDIERLKRDREDLWHQISEGLKQ